VSALFGVDPATGQLPGTAEAEAEQLFTNLKAILRLPGGALGDVVRVGIFTTHLQRDRPALNEVWKRAFGDHRPARSAVEATAFGRPGENARFMVEVTARIRDASGGTDREEPRPPPRRIKAEDDRIHPAEIVGCVVDRGSLRGSTTNTAAVG